MLVGELYEEQSLPVSTAKFPPVADSTAQPCASSRLRALPYLFCAALLLALISYNFIDIDLWHQMGLIRASLRAGHLLTQDPFAYTPTIQPMVDHEWGAGVLAFFAAQWLGGAGILLLKFTAAFGAIGIAIRIAESRGATPAVLAFLVPLGVCLSYLGFLPAIRAHAYSFLFTAGLIWVFEMDRVGERRWLLASIACFPLWVNLHGGFVVGLGFTGLFAIEQMLARKPYRHILVVLALFALGTLVNPYGSAFFSYLVRALTMARARIPEWGPIWTLNWPFTTGYIIAVLVAAYSVVATRTSRIAGVLLILVSALEALLHRKFLPFFAITWIAYVPAMFQSTAAGAWLQNFSRKRRRFLLIAAGALIAACLISAIRTPFWRVQVPQVPGEASYPVGAVEYLRQLNFHGNIMVPFRSGAYVSWKLYPAVKVSIDSRYEVAYPDTWVESSFRFYEGAEGWQNTLAAYPTDLVLARQNSPVTSRLGRIGWNLIYEDAEYEVFSRPGLGLPLIDRNTTEFHGTFP